MRDAVSKGSRSLAVEVTDFGPISKGKVDLKPLTVLVGPNGSGKSHITMLLYTISLFERYCAIGHLHFYPGFDDQAVTEQLQNASTWIYDQYKSGQKVLYTDVLKMQDPKAGLGRVADGFLVRRDSIIRHGKTLATIRIASDISGSSEVNIRPKDIDLDGFGDSRIRIRFCESDDEQTDDRDIGVVKTIPITKPSTPFEICDELKRHISNMTDFRNSGAYYFPAERAGLMQAHDALTKPIPHPVTDSEYVDQLPRIARDYLGWMDLRPNKTGPFAAMAVAAERLIFGGEIAVDPNHPRLGNVFFHQGEHRIPLRVAASSVKDMAPFFIYLKFAAKMNDLVVLEEPEINLHPANQILLARFIAQLVNHGLYLVVATHSPYFLEQLSHCVKSGTIDDSRVVGILADDERISLDDVAAYKFTRNGGGYNISPIRTSNDGIPQHEFIEVDNKLYDELLRLRQLEPE